MGQTHTMGNGVSISFETSRPMRIEDVAIELYRHYIGDQEVTPNFGPCYDKAACGWNRSDTTSEVYDLLPGNRYGPILYEVGVRNGQLHSDDYFYSFKVKVVNGDNARISQAIKALTVKRRL